MTYRVRTQAQPPLQSAGLLLDQLRRSFDAIDSIVRLSAIADGGSDPLVGAVQIICESGSRTTDAIEAALRRSRDAPPVPAAQPQPRLRAEPNGNGATPTFTVRGRPWTIDRLVHWTATVETRLALLPEEQAYTTWRADLAGAGIGIEPTDDWPCVQSRLEAHWERLGSDYARHWWAHQWYTRILDPRPCGWPDDDA